MSDKNSTPTTESRVQEAIKNATRDDKGGIVFAEGTDELVQYAARSEIRRRDTQSAYTKSQQTVKTLTAENDKLAASWEQDAVANLSATQKAKLDELKIQDPDAWRAEITKMEDEQRTAFKEKRETISKEVSQMTELEQREQTLAEFNEANPDIDITDDFIQNDLPPRITKKLENGEITFAQFLDEAKTYATKGKVIQKTEAPDNGKNLSTARGGHSPELSAQEAQSSTDYKDEVY